jgi:hypothetical protein
MTGLIGLKIRHALPGLFSRIVFSQPQSSDIWFITFNRRLNIEPDPCWLKCLCVGKRTQRRPAADFQKNYSRAQIPFRIKVILDRAPVPVDLALALLKAVSRSQPRQGGKPGSVRSSRGRTGLAGVPGAYRVGEGS